MRFRALKEDEIEVRAAQITAKGARFLLYKDARCDMNILDETFGIFGWERKHEFINNKEFCTVSIKDNETGEWVSKQDCGTESNTEKEKGESSDAFKRACFNWGLGRELYTKIFIFIRGISEPDPNRQGAYKLKNPFEKYSVSKVSVDEDRKKITNIEIVDSGLRVVFEWNEDLEQKRPKKTEDEKPTKETVAAENDFNKAFENKLTKCEVCGEQIKGTKTQPADMVAQKTFDKYGKKLCVACARELNAKQTA